jgi:hypothetical protein
MSPGILEIVGDLNIDPEVTRVKKDSMVIIDIESDKDNPENCEKQILAKFLTDGEPPKFITFLTSDSKLHFAVFKYDAEHIHVWSLLSSQLYPASKCVDAGRLILHQDKIVMKRSSLSLQVGKDVESLKWREKVGESMSWNIEHHLLD